MDSFQSRNTQIPYLTPFSRQSRNCSTPEKTESAYKIYFIHSKMQKYVVEFLGAALFIYVILATGNALAIGATLALIILISGAQVNPAVSITMAAAGKLPTVDLVPFCIAQILGGLVALEIYKRFKI